MNRRKRSQRIADRPQADDQQITIEMAIHGVQFTPCNERETNVNPLRTCLY
jgi:hypothetical protein